MCQTLVLWEIENASLRQASAVWSHSLLLILIVSLEWPLLSLDEQEIQSESENEAFAVGGTRGLVACATKLLDFSSSGYDPITS